MRGYTQDKDAYLKRLRRIEGQVRGLQRMVDEDVKSAGWDPAASTQVRSG